jgi:DNA polymerase-3 subunit gamma/tau
LQGLRGGASGGGSAAVVAQSHAVPAPAPAKTTAAVAAKPQASAYVKAAEPSVVAPTAVKENAPAAAAAATGGNMDLQQLWARLVESVGRASPFTRTYLLEAHAVSFARNLFTIGFDPEFEDHISLVDNAKNHTLLATKLTELGHPNTQVKFIKAERPESWAVPVVEPTVEPSPAPSAAAKGETGKAAAASVATPAASAPKEKLVSKPFSKDDFKNDPLIQKALEVFKGKIVDVRG